MEVVYIHVCLYKCLEKIMNHLDRQLSNLWSYPVFFYFKKKSCFIPVLMRVIFSVWTNFNSFRGSSFAFTWKLHSKCLLVAIELKRRQNRHSARPQLYVLVCAWEHYPTGNTLILSCLNSSLPHNVNHRAILQRSFLQTHQETQSRRWTTMNENSVITVREAFPQAKPGDRGCLITRYSMSTCCVSSAKAGTKDLNFETCTLKWHHV